MTDNHVIVQTRAAHAEFLEEGPGWEWYKERAQELEDDARPRPPIRPGTPAAAAAGLGLAFIVQPAWRCQVCHGPRDTLTLEATLPYACAYAEMPDGTWRHA